MYNFKIANYLVMFIYIIYLRKIDSNQNIYVIYFSEISVS